MVRWWWRQGGDFLASMLRRGGYRLPRLPHWMLMMITCRSWLPLWHVNIRRWIALPTRHRPESLR
jgi:hypothetical protein